jgi:hypothetical protein
MEPSALALKGTVTHGSQKYKYLLHGPKERGFLIFFQKGVMYVDWIEIFFLSSEMGIEPVTDFSDPQPVSRLRSSSSGEPQREKIMRFCR